MTSKNFVLVLALALSNAAIGGSSSFESPADGDAVPAAFVPAFDALTASYEFQNGMEFDDSDAEIDSWRFDTAAFLSQPISLGGGWNFLPAVDYSMTSLDFSNTPAGYGIDDEDLHKVSLHATFYNNPVDSRWLFLGWARASFASDTQHIDSDDFYFDVALSGGYRVTDRFMLALGVAGLELGGDAQIVAGPGFYWKPNDEIDVNLIGVMFNAIWRPSDDWAFALRVRPFGNSWNIDNGGESQNMELSSYTVRLHAERRIYRDTWLSLGVGYAFANEFELRDSSNDRLFKEDLSGGLSTSIGLRVRTW